MNRPLNKKKITNKGYYGVTYYRRDENGKLWVERYQKKVGTNRRIIEVLESRAECLE